MKKYEQVVMKEAMINVINDSDSRSEYHVWDTDRDEMLDLIDLNIADVEDDRYVVFKSISDTK